MKSLLLCLSCLAVLLAGCTQGTPDDSSLPWARPADWEGAPPGMSNMPGAQGGGRR